MGRKLIWLGILAALLFVWPATVFAEQAAGKAQAFEDPASHRSMMAVRDFASLLGGEVTWNGAERTVNIVVYGHPPLCLDLNGGTLNGIPLEPKPYIREGSTFIPLRPLAEALGINLLWDGRYIYLCPGGRPPIKIGYNFVIGSYTITFSRREAMTSNFANACLAGWYLNGKVVPPAGVFSFNAAVGERIRERGFIPGIVFQGRWGQSTEVGGGVCRAATLLHNAVLAAGLQVVERHRHGQPVTYVPPGRDATVYYGIYDYRFRNNRPDPIRLEFQQAGPSITMTIWQLAQV